MVYKMSILERLLIGGLLPKEGSMVTLKIIREMKSKLSFSEKEIADFELVGNGESVSWNPDKVYDVEIELGEVAVGIIASQLRKLDSEGKLTEQHLDIYDRFVK